MAIIDLEYKVSDIINIKRKNTPSANCLVIEIKKQFGFYEVTLFSSGKIFTIVDDGNFYNIQKLN